MIRKMHGWLTHDRKFFSSLDEAEEHEKTLKQYEVELISNRQETTEIVWAQDTGKAEAKALNEYGDDWCVTGCKEVD